MLRAYKYRIFPNKEQAELIEKTFGCCRTIYNLGITASQNTYNNSFRWSRFSIQRQLPELKKHFPFFAEVNSQALQSAIYNLDHAFTNLVGKTSKFPRYKKKEGRQSFQCPDGLRTKIDFDGGLLSIPKIKNIKIVLSRRFDGKVRTTTISREPSGKYFASILVDTFKPKPIPNKVNQSTSIGIDMGVKSLMVLSNGQLVENNTYLERGIKRLQALSRRMSLKKKGGANWTKAKNKLNNYHEKIRNKRKDYLHKVTSSLVYKNHVSGIFVENLNVRSMMSDQQFGKLSRRIGDASMADCIRMIKYKSEWVGKHCIEIDRHEPSTKTCNSCGLVRDEELPLNVRSWSCECGHNQDRDHGAAINILRIGLGKAKALNLVENQGEGVPVGLVEPLKIFRAVKQETFINSPKGANK